MCFRFGLRSRGEAVEEVPLVSVWLGEVVADNNFDFLNFSASRLLPTSRDRPGLFPVIKLSPPLVTVVLVFLLLVLLLKLVVVVVAMVVVALVTVFGEDLVDSLEEDEECDLPAEPSLPDSSTKQANIMLS